MFPPRALTLTSLKNLQAVTHHNAKPKIHLPPFSNPSAWSSISVSSFRSMATQTVKDFSHRSSTDMPATHSGPTTEIRIAIKSFDRPLSATLPPHTRRVALPDSRTLFTVIRGPHVHKKSREQFEMRIRKQLLVIRTQASLLREKYFWLKRWRIPDAQFEILFRCKTRLDKNRLQTILQSADADRK